MKHLNLQNFVFFFANSWNFTEFSELTMFKNFAMSRDIRLITKSTYVIFHLAVEDDNFSSIFSLPYELISRFETKFEK